MTDDVVETARTWLGEGRPVAMATVVETWGSSPRPRGSQLVVRDDGLFVGSVSGGCVEGKVVEAAQTAMTTGKHELLEFGVSNEEAWVVGLACGGTVRIFVEPVTSPVVLDALAAARKDKRAIVLLTPLDGTPARTWSRGEPLEAALEEAAVRAVAMDDASTAGNVFVQAFNPQLALVVIGAVHIAEPLSKIAVLLGYDVTLVDPRESFARAERWPGMNVSTDFPDEVLAKMSIDHRTAIVALTHDPKIDDPGLEAALKSPAFYVGALGSKKTHATRVARLTDRGFSADDVARIRGPIGLDIGARSPGEIAVSIIGQMTETLRRGKATPRA